MSGPFIVATSDVQTDLLHTLVNGSKVTDMITELQTTCSTIHYRDNAMDFTEHTQATSDHTTE